MRRFVLLGVAGGLALTALLDAFALRAGLAAGIVPRSGEPWLWVSSRAAGVTAYVALTLDVAFGLFVSTGSADRWIARNRSVEVHRWLAGTSLALIAVHALLLLGDGFSRFDLLDAVVPFIAPHRPAAVALGIVAAYLAIAVQGTFEFRHRFGVGLWKRLHRASFVVFGLATLHGILAGSDTGLPWMQAIYLLAATSIGMLGLHRGISAWHSIRRAHAR
jgi:sulfoxide reductase heme-binding subunit YedZ